MNSSERVRKASSLIARMASLQRKVSEYRRKALVAQLERAQLEVELLSLIAGADPKEAEEIDGKVNQQRHRFALAHDKHLWKKLLRAP